MPSSRMTALVAAFTPGHGVGGSSSTVNLMKRLDFELSYLVADFQDHPQDVFGQDLPHLIHNPLRPKPHIRIGNATAAQVLARNIDIHRDIRWLRRQDRIARQSKADLVISMPTLMSRADVFDIRLLRAQSFLQRYGYSSEWHERILQFMDIKERHTLAIERRNLRPENHRLLIVSSNQMKDAVQKHYQVPDEKIMVIPNSLDLDRFRPPLTRERISARRRLGLSEQQRMILFVGRSPQRKGADALVQAIGRLKDEDVVLHLVGFEHHPYIENLAKAQSADIRISGEVSIADLATVFYWAADLCILPARLEPFGGVILESMASGVPTIVTTECGAAEILRHREHVWKIEGRDIVQSAIKHLLANQEVRNQLGRNAALFTRRMPTWGMQAHALQKRLETLVAEVSLKHHRS